MKIAVLSDVHAPYENKQAVDLFIKVVKAYKPDVLVAIGDVADFYALSAHRKDPGKMEGFLPELEKVHSLMKKVNNLAPRKIFCEGNHENRLQRYVFDRAPELYGYLTVESALNLKEWGWEYHPYQEVVNIGPVGFVHDLGYAGVNSSRQTIQAYPANLVYGHSHRFNCFTAGDLRRNTYTCWNVGWLGDPRQIDYLPSVKVKLDWVKGFLFVDIIKGTPFFTPLKITDNKVLFRGKVYSE